MNPLIQLNRQLQYLFIALLLACFAIPAMGERDETPNHREFFLHTITRQVPSPCGSETVDIRGMVKLKFGFKRLSLRGPYRAPLYACGQRFSKGDRQHKLPKQRSV